MGGGVNSGNEANADGKTGARQSRGLNFHRLAIGAFSNSLVFWDDIRICSFSYAWELLIEI